MKVAVIGLGVEGNKAVNSLLNNGYEVYASDLNPDIDLEEKDSLDIDLGFHDIKKIDESDAVLISPSLWNTNLAKKLRETKKSLADIISKHRSIFTIGVTGTNGKTTTSFMIKKILENAGNNVLIGGNAGGGFRGYTDLIIESAKDDYDYLLVEVCDMTMDFASDFFDFDLIVATNIGRDHLNYHKTLDNYKESLCRFIEGKPAILNKNDPNLSKIVDCSDKTLLFNYYHDKLKIFGKFNQSNAAAAEMAARYLKISEDIIKNSLEHFETIDGRLKQLNINKSNIVIGKTDNVDAINAAFNEMKFEAVILGTPRKNELYRLDILNETVNHKPLFIGLFNGLDNIAMDCLEILHKKNYDGMTKVFNEIEEIVDFIYNSSSIYPNILVAGNGQPKIMEIEKRLLLKTSN
ncbi:MAG: Mur ligase family protein [Methanobacteriaceae archaeon]|nr:Mur ligase family protein [Methanobacteriaceae archaeon]